VDHGFALGIDLHGTLLDKGWTVPDSLAGDLRDTLESLSPVCDLFLCTGNDLTFLNARLDTDLLVLFDGYVLETGCVVSRGQKEEILVPDDTLARIKELEDRLRKVGFQEVCYFARRLATISMFTRTETGGTDPALLFPEVSAKVKETGFGDDVFVTHSDVAVDIIPMGFNKLTGLRLASAASVLIGIADSLNDLHLIRGADLAFLPANASPSLLKAIEEGERPVVALEEWGPASGAVGMAPSPHTEGVIEILRSLRHHLQ
jgi:hydroxymethylpyrimidine pyrophosphatase-like HAD family hydrolase